MRKTDSENLLAIADQVLQRFEDAKATCESPAKVEKENAKTRAKTELIAAKYGVTLEAVERYFDAGDPENWADYVTHPKKLEAYIRWFVSNRRYTESHKEVCYAEH